MDTVFIANYENSSSLNIFGVSQSMMSWKEDLGWTIDEQNLSTKATKHLPPFGLRIWHNKNETNPISLKMTQVILKVSLQKGKIGSCKHFFPFLDKV